MYKIICDFCGTVNKFITKSQRPAECSNKACQNSLGGLEVINETMEDKEKEISEIKKLLGMKLIYQKTSEEIIIKTDSIAILGRENFGSEVLGKIEQISRSHCSIDFKNNRFLVRDLDSLNGTFIGVGAERTACTIEQELNDKDFLALGKEIFLVQFIREEKLTKTENISEVEVKKSKEPKEILCTECSCVLKNIPCSCPDCGTWNE